MELYERKRAVRPEDERLLPESGAAVKTKKTKVGRRAVRPCAVLPALTLALGLAACGSPAAPSLPPSATPTPKLEATATPAPPKAEATSAPTAEPTPEVAAGVDELTGFFAIADESGTGLIVLESNWMPTIEAPERLDVAVGYGGGLTPLRYAGYQEGDPEQRDGRATFYSFDDMSGHVYEATAGGFDTEWPQFVTSGTLFPAAFIPLAYHYADEYSFVAADAAAQRAGVRRLDVVYSAELAASEEGGAVELFQYERSGDDMLFEIVYRDGAQEIAVEFPAQYDAYSTWRVDAGDPPGMSNVLFLAHTEGGMVMATLWSGPEGGAVSVWAENDGVWVQSETVGAYLYWF